MDHYRSPSSTPPPPGSLRQRSTRSSKRKTGDSGGTMLSDNPMFSNRSKPPVPPGLPPSMRSEGSYAKPPTPKRHVSETSSGGHRQVEEFQPLQGRKESTNAPKVGKKASVFSFGSHPEEEVHLEEIEDIDYDSEQARIRALPIPDRWYAMKLPQRMTVAFTAVIILWLTSLAMVRFVVEDLMFPSESFDEVVEGLELFFNFSSKTKSDFSTCSTNELVECTASYESKNTAEINRATAAAEANDQNLASLATDRIDAREALNVSLTALLSISGVALPGLLLDSTDVVNCPRAISFARQRVAASVSAGAYGDFVGDTDDIVNQIMALHQQTEEYDREYYDQLAADYALHAEEMAALQKEKTDQYIEQMNQAMADFEQCMNGATCPLTGGDGVNGILVGAGAEFDNQLNRSQEAYKDMNQTIQEFYDNYAKLLALLEELPVVDPSGVPSESNDPNFELPFDIDAELAEIQASIDNMISKGEQAIGDATNSASESIDKFGAAINSVDIGGMLNPNPPTLDPTAFDQYKIDQDERDKQFEESMENLQNGGGAEEFTTPSQVDTEFPEPPIDVVSSLTNRSFDFFSYPKSFFTGLNANIALAADLLVKADIIFRIVKTFTIFNKYWNMSKIGKPPGDARVHIMKGTVSGHKATSTQKMAARLTSPGVVNLLAIAFVIALVYGFWTLYSPFYYAFVDGCVTHDDEDLANNETEGTMIVNNLFSMSYNFASEDGDSIQTTETEKLNVQIDIDCTQNFDETSTVFNNQVELFSALKTDYDEAVALRTEIMTCFAHNEMATNSNAQIRDAEAVIQENIGFTASINATFENDMEDLADGVYNCETVSPCEIGCDIPSVVQFRARAWDEGCRTEHFAHSTFLAFIVVIFTFVLMIFFRKQFMSSLVRLWWRNLNPFDFNFLGSCTKYGKHIDPEEVSQHGETFQDAAAIALAEALRNWERQGYLLMAAAFGLHVPWIAAGLFLSQQIQYG